MLHHITIIAFDLDDTLWPCAPTIVHAEEMLYRWLSQHYPRITARYDPQQIFDRRKQFITENPEFSIDMSLMRHQFLRFLATESDYNADIVDKDGFDVFFHARQQVTFYDDALPGLARLKKRYRLGSISNGNASVEHVGLGHLFEQAVNVSDLNIAKPDLRIFEHFAQLVKTPVEQILYVGDHPIYDVVGPEKAGMQAVWMNREGLTWPNDLPKPRYEVADIPALEALLAT